MKVCKGRVAHWRDSTFVLAVDPWSLLARSLYIQIL